MSLGFTEPALNAYILFVYLHSTFVHANVRFDFGCLEHVSCTPRFHHWHHGIEKEAIDVNFAVHFPLLDRLFGTYLPARQATGRPATASAAIRCRTATGGR